MRVLVACEESQRVCIAFRAKGHEAYSCDIEPWSGGHPEWHIQDDVLKHLGDNWDLVIAHPPCTYLTVAANKYYNVERYGEKAIIRQYEREKAIDFFLNFAWYNLDCPKVCIENPIGIMSSIYGKPTQIIQPYQFGHTERKATCLWLNDLPLLTPTEMVEPGEIIKGGYSVGAHADGRDENGTWLKFNDPELAKLRSKTFPGIAKAMAEQWAGPCKED